MQNLTYDIHFNDEVDSNCKGWACSFDYCKNYITIWNGTSHSYFNDYEGGEVSIVCNETGETVYFETVYKYSSIS